MTIGSSILLVLIGAILRFAVTWTPDGINLQVVGVILMIGGAVGLVVAITVIVLRRRNRPPAQVYEERRYTEPPGG
jgi:Domain of unknown function (DUF6458)